MPSSYTHSFATPLFQGDVTIDTGLFIGGKWVDPVEGGAIDVVNPVTGNVITAVAAGTAQDIDLAVDAAELAYKTSWGLKVPGITRGKLLSKLADLVQCDVKELAALEALNVGKSFILAEYVDVNATITFLHYYAGLADKISGKTIETNDAKFSYTRREPFGVVGLIVPWNLPLMMAITKLAPALAAGNTVVLKPSEVTPLTALKLANLINEAGFPPGVVNIVNGAGSTVGQALSEHMKIWMVGFTGSTATGRKVLKAAAESNLKKISLELGGKSPTIVFDDADLDQAVKWAAQGLFFNMGQACIAGSRIFLHEPIYDAFLTQFTAVAEKLSTQLGDPFNPENQYGPQVSQIHFDRVMGYISSGKESGATLHLGGERHGQEGYFIQPTIFTDVTNAMQIAREEIFGPVGVIIKFKTEEEAIALANDTSYGLSSSVFSQNISRALRVTNALEAGYTFVNCSSVPEYNMPFGGYKQSGIGREFGEEGLESYTQIKTVQINIGQIL